MAAFTDMFLYGLIVPVLPFMLKDRMSLQDDHVQSTVSNLLATFATAACAASPIAGILADRYYSSRKSIYTLGLMMLMVSVILLAIGRSIHVLVIARILQGASGSVVWTIGLVLVRESVGLENLGKSMGTISSFAAVAGLLSPSVGGFLYTESGYAGVFGIGMGLVAVDLVLRLLTIENNATTKYTSLHSQAPAPSLDSASEEYPSLNNIHKKYRLRQPTNRLTRAFPVLLFYRHTGLLTATWIGFTQGMLLGAFDATLSLQASEQLGTSSFSAGLLFLPLGCADFLLGPAFGWAVDRYGTRLISVLGFVWLIPTLLLLRLPAELSTMGLKNTTHLTMVFAGILVLNGIGLANINSPATVESSKIVDKYFKANGQLFDQAPYAQLYGINNMIWSCGLAAGPLFAGKLREEIGYGNMNAVLASICASTAIVAALFIGRKEEVHSVCDEQYEIDGRQ